MAYVKSMKALSFATPNGYGIVLEPKVPTWIPDPALKHALDKGALECDEKGALKFNDDSGEDQPPVDEPVVPVLNAEDRANEDKRFGAIVAACKYLLVRGSPKDFRKDNLPKTAAVERVLGFAPTGTELVEAFSRAQEEV